MPGHSRYSQKGEKAMNYVRPEVAVLGDAIDVIESIPSLKGTASSDGMHQVNPAYDLDE